MVLPEVDGRPSGVSVLDNTESLVPGLCKKLISIHQLFVNDIFLML